MLCGGHGVSMATGRHTEKEEGRGTQKMNGDSEEVDPLEASWASLDLFNKTHSGRICGGLELERALTVEESAESGESESESCDFIIPELPGGRQLELLLHSTWGDPYYVGLSGLELFAEDGNPVGVSGIRVDASTLGSGTVPGFVSVRSLLDVGFTASHDDTRLWWAARRPGTPLRLILDLEKETRLAMLRIWNYNKSRVHAARGVRKLQVRLDDELIFDGEISKAEPAKEDDEETGPIGDTILFTSSNEILERILANDHFLAEERTPRKPPTPSEPVARPGTGEMLARGRRKPQGSGPPGPPEMSRKQQRQDPKEGPAAAVGPAWDALSIQSSQLVLQVKRLQLELVGNWGAEDTVGLGAVRLIGRQGAPLALAALNATAAVKPARGQNIWRCLEGSVLSTSAEDQWLGPWDGARAVTLSLNFPATQELAGIAFWNYNAGLEATYSGARLVNIYVDGSLVLAGVELRKAPGSLHYDYVQEIFFGDAPAAPPQAPLCVRGFSFQIQLHSTWGDDFYIGLNGIRLLDEDEKPIPLQIKNIAAFPESVNVLSSVQGDPRSSDKLIDDVCDTDEPTHMWLAPLLPSQMNRVYVIFDRPRNVRSVEIWNYRKTPERGARDVLVLVDDWIVFDGEIPISSAEKTGCLRVELAGEATS